MPTAPRIAIVDYGMGNLFSVRHACAAAGLDPEVTADRAAILAADAVIVPGVGAFGDAMATLRKLGLDGTIQDVAAAGTPLVGICLGLQLFMTESEEFGRHRGLGLFAGPVVRFERLRGPVGGLKVPAVGWNRIHPARATWTDSPLDGIAPGAFLYFVHSYYAKPADPAVVLSTTRYGETEYCSSLARGNVFACQFHPERSGSVGLAIYRNLAGLILKHA